MQNKISFNN